MSAPGESAKLLLRIFKRKTSLEEKDIDEIRTAEFLDGSGAVDLRLSVYEIDRSDVVRTIVEHSAGAGLDRVSNTPGHPDLRPCTACAAVATPGDNHWFRFPTAAHRELQLDDVSQVDEIIRRLKEGESEFYACSRSDAARYIKGQIEAGDPDWANFLTHHAKRTKWKALADKG